MFLRTAIFCLFSLLATAAFGQTTVIGSWTMGDNDAGAANGVSVNSTLTAATGTNLTLAGSGLTYTSTVDPQTSGSLAVNFNGSGHYTTSSNLGLSTSFVMETWVNFSSLSTTQWVMLVGNGATSGAGILLTNSTLNAAKSGVNQWGAVSISTNTWYHVALVVDGSSNAALYLNGNLVTGSGFTAVSSFNSNFSLGGDESGSARLTGILDDTKVFTYTGTFNTSMLNYTAVPEPATWAALAGLSVLGLACWRRRRRTAPQR